MIGSFFSFRYQVAKQSIRLYSSNSGRAIFVISYLLYYLTVRRASKFVEKYSKHWEMDAESIGKAYYGGVERVEKFEEKNKDWLEGYVEGLDFT